MTPADLRALVERATKGEWVCDAPEIYSVGTSPAAEPVVWMGVEGGDPGGVIREEDGEAIAALHNLAPALLALWEVAEASHRGGHQAPGRCAICVALAALRATGERT